MTADGRLALGGGVTGDFAENVMQAHPWLMPAVAGVTWRLSLTEGLRDWSDGRVSGTGWTLWTPQLSRETTWIVVRLSPPSAFRVLGMPLAELADQEADLAALYRGAADDLMEALRETSQAEERFGLVRRFIATRAELGSPPAPEVAWVWRRLVATGGRIPIRDAAAEVGWSHQHLTRTFGRQLGRSPKNMARLIRFRALLRRVERLDPTARWDDLAAEHGYYDQAHLHRDFKQFASTTPGRLLARRLPCGCLSQ